MVRRSFTSTLMTLTALSLLILPAQAAPPDHAEVNRQLAEIRQATAQYHDVAVAIADGYELGPDPDCVPGMGYHYVKDAAIAGDQSGLDPLEPAILVYAPRNDGTHKLVAVEYASWAPAELFGRTFDPPGGPPFHTLHAWVWQANPDGLFAAHNPNVSCD